MVLTPGAYWLRSVSGKSAQLQFDSPFVRRVALAMHHYGLVFEHRPWSVWSQADEIAAFNPLRRVPILVTDDNENLVESAAILDALDEMVADDRRLLPKAGPIRRAGLRVCALAMGLADKAVSLFYEGVLRKEEARSALWMDRCATQIEDTLGVLEREKATRGEFWFGALSHADIAVGCALRFLGEALPTLAFDKDNPALSAHARRCEASALFQRAVQPLHVAL